MSILAITLVESNREEMEGWASTIAAAHGASLDFVRVLADADQPEGKAGKNGLEFTASEDGGLRTAVVSINDAAAILEAYLKSNEPELLLIDQHAGRRGERAQLAKAFFETAACDILCLRFPEDGGRGGGRILAPTVGGPHSKAALKLASKLAQKDEEGKLVPLLVEPNVDDLSADVGLKRLADIVAQTGLKTDSDKIDPRVRLASDPTGAIHEEAKEGDFDLVLLGASDAGGLHRALFGTLPDRLLAGSAKVAVGVFRRADPLGRRLRNWIGRRLHLTVPQLDRGARVALFESLETNARWSFDFMALICLSTALAGLGLMLDSAAVVIGAMLVAPLMTPLLGAGLALVQGNLVLMRDCAKAILLGFLAALVIGLILGALGSFYGLTHQMRMRGSPDVPDLVVAFLSGVAAAYCVARPKLTAALAGVAIAAALVPPIATTGITLAMGEPRVARGAALLFGTNVVFIILGAACSFYATGVRARKRERGRTIWSQRALLLLMAAAAVLAIPLASVLIERIAGSRSGDEETYNLATDVGGERRLRPVMESVVAEGGGDLLELELNTEADIPRVTVGVRIAAVDEQELAEKLAKAAREHFEGPVTVRLWTRNLVEVDAP